jgi:SAM-dependent methyltransferase
VAFVSRAIESVEVGAAARRKNPIWAHADRLACPVCRQALAGSDILACSVCGRRFGIRDGIPLLVAERSTATIDLERVATEKDRYRRHPWLARILYPTLVNNHFQKVALNRFLDSFPSSALVLDLGCSLIDRDPRALRLDLVFSANLDLVADAEALPYLDRTVDGVLCTGLLEHVEHPDRVASEIFRVLRPGGRAYIAAPFIQGYHPSPTDFRRYTPEGIRQLLAAFEIESLRATRGSGSSLAWILAGSLTALLSFNQPWLFRLVGVPVRWLCWPLKYLDYVLVNNRYDRYVTSGFTVEARKPGE